MEAPPGRVFLIMSFVVSISRRIYFLFGIMPGFALYLSDVTRDRERLLLLALIGVERIVA